MSDRSEVIGLPGSRGSHRRKGSILNVKEGQPDDNTAIETLYNPNFKNTLQEGALAIEHKLGSKLTSEEFLSDNELYFLQHLSNNEALLEYYHYIQEGLCSIFIQAKIVDSKFKIDGASDASNALSLAGEIIPEVGGVLTKIAAVMEFRNEQVIKEKLTKMSLLIRDDMKNLIAKYIASKLVIKRRTFLTGLTMDHIKQSISSFEKIKLIFDDSNVHVLKA